MAVELSPQHRDALFRRVLVDFDGFGDLLGFIAQGDLEQAYKYGRRIADGFRLLADGGLGWEQRSTGPTTLTLPPVELRRIIGRMHEEALAEWESGRSDREETERDWAEVTDARDASASILDQI